ncbi:MAG: ABC transporter ATP-binding protein [Alistipes sp.]|nr:ABC transporter ATP-binding protein [Alistipes sp.]
MITLNNLTLAYQQKCLLRSANVTFGSGTLTALVGRNGAGKSTLLRAIAAIDNPAEGSVLLKGENLHKLNAEQRAKLISFVSTQRVRIANMLCQDVVAIGRAPYTNWLGSMQPQDKLLVSNALEAVGMSDFARRAIDTLSDGECQRIMIARALAQQTPVIVLDEPTAFLDIPTRFEICRLLSDLAKSSGKTIIFSTHDIDAAMPVCDTFAILENATLTLHSGAEAQEQIKTLFSL